MAQKDDKKSPKRTTKSRQKRQPIAALFNCVFLETKKRKSGSLLSVFYIEIFDFDSFDMILKFPCIKYEYFWKDCVY